MRHSYAKTQRHIHTPSRHDRLTYNGDVTRDFGLDELAVDYYMHIDASDRYSKTYPNGKEGHKEYCTSLGKVIEIAKDEGVDAVDDITMGKVISLLKEGDPSTNVTIHFYRPPQSVSEAKRNVQPDHPFLPEGWVRTQKGIVLHPKDLTNEAKMAEAKQTFTEVFEAAHKFVWARHEALNATAA